MHILNRDFIIENQNDILRQQFGDRIGQKCYKVYKEQDTPCEICRMREAIATNEIQRTELQMSDGRHYEQSYAPFTDVDGTVKVLIMLRDITEERAHQAETMRAAQLASIGELAAGVAHEINNPINGIINYAQILQDQIDTGQNSGDILGRIIREGERIAAIVSNLLAFARDHNEEVDFVMVDTVIDDALALINHKMFKDGILVTVEIPENLPLVQVNPQRLQQVFLNLLSNARYALNQRYSGKDPGKTLIIACHRILLEDRTFVRIRFTDQGIGIPPETIDKIFDPFFSTKKPGEGTGLGLSISHGLVKDFHGFLRVESVPNQFTALTIDLPGYDPGVMHHSGKEIT
jgi:signal transduction histidine kinase